MVFVGWSQEMAFVGWSVTYADRYWITFQQGNREVGNPKISIEFLP